MQIGEFAKLCNTKISVLRHYDKEGILIPDYIDRFTGYRYYQEEQKRIYDKISEWKKAGFTLAEIKEMFRIESDRNEFMKMLDVKEAELEETLKKLHKVRANLKLTVKNAYLQEQKEYCWIHENIDLPFENDEEVIGKWETVGEYAEKADFYQHGAELEETVKELYFLPNGERYWCYGWTKGKVLIEDGYNSCVSPYVIEWYQGKKYMFVSLKSYIYRQTGKPTILVLKQINQNVYTAAEISRKDDLNKPFVSDERIIGKWISHSFCSTYDEFAPERKGSQIPDIPELYFRSLEFMEGGHCKAEYGDEIISGDEQHTWTKGYWLRKFNHCACAYEIRVIDGEEYLFVEWKSGDYRWGGFDTDYYVFTREKSWKNFTR